MDSITSMFLNSISSDKLSPSSINKPIENGTEGFDEILSGVNGLVDSLFNTQKVSDNLNDPLAPIEAVTKTDVSTKDSLAFKNFGPPVGVEVEGFDYHNEANDDNNVTDFGKMQENVQNKNSEEMLKSTGDTTKSGEDETKNDMDLNKDGIVSMKEMLEYYGVDSTDENQETADNSAIDTLLRA